MKTKDLMERLGNIDDRLVQEAQQEVNRTGARKNSGFRSALTLAAAVALMAVSFALGALAFGDETAVEVPVPVQQETIELPELGLTLILPNSWKERYGVAKSGEGECVVYSPKIREAWLEKARREFGNMWKAEWEEDYYAGGMLFYIMRYEEQATETQVRNGEGIVPFAAYQYLLTTKDGTYILYYASDVQFTQETMEEYQEMQQEIGNIRIVVEDVLQ